MDRNIFDFIKHEFGASQEEENGFRKHKSSSIIMVVINRIVTRKRTRIRGVMCGSALVN